MFGVKLPGAVTFFIKFQDQTITGTIEINKNMLHLDNGTFDLKFWQGDDLIARFEHLEYPASQIEFVKNNTHGFLVIR